MHLNFFLFILLDLKKFNFSVLNADTWLKQQQKNNNTIFGKKVKNWKQKLLSVWLKEENKPKLTPQQLTDEETYKKNEEAANLWK